MMSAVRKLRKEPVAPNENAARARDGLRSASGCNRAACRDEKPDTTSRITALRENANPL